MEGHLLNRMGVTVDKPLPIDNVVGEVVASHGVPSVADAADQLSQVLLCNRLRPDCAQLGEANTHVASMTSPVDI